MSVMNMNLFDYVDVIERVCNSEDKKLFISLAYEIADMLNNVNGDFLVNIINDRTISLLNETACPCYNKLRADGCAVVEEYVNEILNQNNKKFTASFVSCSKHGQSCCKLLMKFN